MKNKILKSLGTLVLGAGLSFNFSFGQSNSSALQYSENMRYSDSQISYKIESCSPETKSAIEKTIELLEEKTILDFYEVNVNEKILFTFRNFSQDTTMLKGKEYTLGGLGGGKGKKVEQFNVMKNGRVTLGKSEKCFNVILHETLHVLGFKHSTNPKDILFPIATRINGECYNDFNVNENIYKLINKLYAVPNQADLVLSKIIPKRENNNYLNLDVEIKNIGLKNSEKSALNIYLNNKIIETIKIEELNRGSVLEFIIHDIELKKEEAGKLKIIIENNFEELDKKNNEKIFDISQIK